MGGVEQHMDEWHGVFGVWAIFSNPNSCGIERGIVGT